MKITNILFFIDNKLVIGPTASNTVTPLGTSFLRTTPIVNIGEALLETEASDIITQFLSPLLRNSDISFFVDPYV